MRVSCYLRPKFHTKIKKRTLFYSRLNAIWFILEAFERNVHV